MNFYSYVRTNRTVAAKEVVAAKTVSDISTMIASTFVQDKYNFVKNDEIAKAYGTIKSADIALETLPNGNLVNRLSIVAENGRKAVLRCFGKRENPVDAHPLTADEIKKLSFGTCTSGSETITDAKLDPKTGEVVNIPRVYANIEAL